MAEDLFDRLGAVLAECDIDAKPGRVQGLADDWNAGRLHAAGVAPAPPISRGYPARPLLIEPQLLPKRRPGSVEGRAGLIHAIAHIEYSAIDLALDHAFRFRDLPQAYYGDWIAVAADEARHFDMLRRHLRVLGYDYGDFPAHDGLWQMAVKSADDVLLRMALVPRLLEARGLDATPPLRAKLAKAGDEAAVSILDVILRDEITHVAVGDRWFRYFCQQQGLEPEAVFRRLIMEHGAPWPLSPMNREARMAAGFSAEELAGLEARPVRDRMTFY